MKNNDFNERFFTVDDDVKFDSTYISSHKCIELSLREEDLIFKFREIKNKSKKYGDILQRHILFYIDEILSIEFENK